MSTHDTEDKVPHVEKQQQTVGERLKEKREQLSLSLDDVAGKLRIRKHYLQAIEEGHYSDLPPGIYAQGFVSLYAETLGFEKAEMLKDFAKEFQTKQQKSVKPTFQVPASETGMPKLSITLASVFLLAVVYGGWSFYQGEGRLMTLFHKMTSDKKTSEETYTAGWEKAFEQREIVHKNAIATPMLAESSNEETDKTNIPDLVEHKVAEATEVLEVSEDKSDPSIEIGLKKPEDQHDIANLSESKKQEVDTPEFKPHKAVEIAAIQDNTDEVTKVATEREIEQVADIEQKQQINVVKKEQKIESTLVLLADEDSWVSMTDNDGRVVMAKTVRKGTECALPCQSGYHVTLGNSGGVRFKYHDEVSAPLGEQGVVLRNVSLAPDEIATRFAHS